MAARTSQEEGLFYRLRHSASEPGYWFQIIADSGQILAESGVFATRTGVESAMATITAEASRARVVDRTLD
jgi:hypothetical protein